MIELGNQSELGATKSWTLEAFSPSSNLCERPELDKACAGDYKRGPDVTIVNESHEGSGEHSEEGVEQRVNIYFLQEPDKWQALERR